VSADPVPLKPLDYLHRAEQFHRAYQDLPRNLPALAWPRYFMLCHAIELSFVAFLSVRGMSDMQLENKFKHNLGKLLAKAETTGLALSKKAARDVELLNDLHEKFWLHYPKNEGLTCPTVDRFEKTTGEILHVFRARYVSGMLALNIRKEVYRPSSPIYRRIQRGDSWPSRPHFVAATGGMTMRRILSAIDRFPYASPRVVPFSRRSSEVVLFERLFGRTRRAVWTSVREWRCERP
jgi:hypothetical protein